MSTSECSIGSFFVTFWVWTESNNTWSLSQYEFKNFNNTYSYTEDNKQSHLNQGSNNKNIRWYLRTEDRMVISISILLCISVSKFSIYLCMSFPRFVWIYLSVYPRNRPKYVQLFFFLLFFILTITFILLVIDLFSTSVTNKMKRKKMIQFIHNFCSSHTQLWLISFLCGSLLLFVCLLMDIFFFFAFSICVLDVFDGNLKKSRLIRRNKIMHQKTKTHRKTKILSIKLIWIDQ